MVLWRRPDPATICAKMAESPPITPSKVVVARQDSLEDAANMEVRHTVPTVASDLSITFT